jgi:hypothetical protein
MLERAEPAPGTNMELPFDHFRQYVTRRGLVAVVSDFSADPDAVVKAVRPRAYQGQDIVFLHVLDPAELEPDFSGATLLEDMETGDQIEVSPDYAKREYRGIIQDHIAAMRRATQGVGADYRVLDTSKPLDLTLREYLLFRQRRR